MGRLGFRVGVSASYSYFRFDLRLQKNRFKYDLRKYSFCNRVVNTWNSLPNYVVSANTTNIFKID